MEKPPIAAIVNFCTNEWRFFPHVIAETAKFARQIIVPVCDHFFDGTAENRNLLNLIYRSFPNCLFVEYPFIPSEIPRHIFRKIDPAFFWCSLSRVVGAAFLHHSIESVLFLDADEVPDGNRFLEWLQASDYQQHTVMKLANYWYFREPTYQSLKWEDSIVLAQAKSLSSELILSQKDRDAIYDLLPGPKRRIVRGTDGEPMFHHFSWVRTKEEMMKKVTSWGHKNDKNWVDLVEKEFSGPFQGIDFVHGYQYKTVELPFKIQLNPEISSCEKEAIHSPNIVKVRSKDLLKMLRFNKNFLSYWISSLFSS